jgi:hypothetical protein
VQTQSYKGIDKSLRHKRRTHLRKDVCRQKEGYSHCRNIEYYKQHSYHSPL